jgi:hypothetical protein
MERAALQVNVLPAKPERLVHSQPAVEHDRDGVAVAPIGSLRQQVLALLRRQEAVCSRLRPEQPIRASYHIADVR